ncbi:MAG: T9SS type A sorting domain-containing protein [Bacteroidetes bacterium]|nr:T9SS type A sorting domain-containing protein [Bacteroidota bacterium]
MKLTSLVGLMIICKATFSQYYDESFNGTGMITGFTTFNGSNMIELPIDVIYEPGTDKIVMMNQFNGLGGTLHRFNSDGSPDLSFGVSGVQEVEPVIENRFLNVFPQTEGYAIAGFVSPAHNVYSPFVMQLNYDGTTKTDFGIDGVNAENSIDSFITYYASMGNSGKISIAGWDYEALFSDPGAGLMQFNADGSYNNVFGFKTFGIEQHTEFRAAYELQDGRTIAYGFTYNVTHDTTVGFVACFAVNGELDLTFGDNGIVIPKPESPYYNYQFYRATQSADGSIYLAGIKANSPEYYIYVVKMDVNGNIDESFGTNGNAYTQATSITDCRQIVVTPDNEIYVLSSGHPVDDATRQTHILKLLANGEPDLTFTNGLPGSFRITIDETDDDIDGFQMIIQPDGKLVVTGRVDGLSGNTDYFLCRITTNSTTIPIENKSEPKINIYPNPTSSSLTLNTNHIAHCYTIVSATGNCIQKAFLYQPETIINIEHIPSGLYFIQVENVDGVISAQSFVKE